MATNLFRAASVTLLALIVAVPAAAQTRTAARDQWRMPHQSGFWGYAGLNVGRSDYDVTCPAGSCDREGDTAKLYFGGKFNNALGLEIGYVNMGKAGFSGGDIEAHGLNVSLVAGFPVGGNSSIFAKLGTTAGRSKVSGTVASVRTGTEDGWGWSAGIGGQIGLTPNWALRLDADRYQFQFVGGARDTIDTLTVGVQYSFR